jgi:uncharacterized protein (TIRG00374 family)
MQRSSPEKEPQPAGRSAQGGTAAAHHWFLIVLAAILLSVIASHRDEATMVLRTLLRGEPGWVLAAAGVQFLYFTLYALIYHTAFKTVGVQSRLRDLLPLWFTSLLVNIPAPTVGQTVFIADAVRRGESGARATAGVILVRISDFASFLLLLGAGLSFLYRHGNLKRSEVIAALILLFFGVGWTGVLTLGIWNPALLRRLLGGARSAVNGLFRLFRRPVPLAPDWPQRQTEEFARAAEVIFANPKSALTTLAVALTAHTVDAGSIYALFRAFHQPVPLDVLIAGYAVGMLFWVVSITPEGIGVVEGAMTLVYHSLGVPRHTAAAVALAFRGLTFYLPILLAVPFLPRVRLLRGNESPAP